MCCLDFWNYLLSLFGSSGRQRWKPGLPHFLLFCNIYCKRISKLMQFKLFAATRLAADEPWLSTVLFVLSLLGFCVEGELTVRQHLLLRKLDHGELSIR